MEDDVFRLALDASRSVSRDFAGVSHAHSDHVVPHSARVLVTPGTASIYSSKKQVLLEYGEKFKQDGVTVSLHNANHVLGSSQFRVEDSEVVAYTGDLRLEPSLFWDCEVVKCDTLVIEATYGLPEYSFPPLEQVQKEMQAFLDKNSKYNLVFGAYKLGKSQEVTKICNDAGVVPVVHSHIVPINQAYEKHGIHLDYVAAGTPEAEEIMKGAFVSVAPVNVLDAGLVQALSDKNGCKTMTAACTGWGEECRTPVNKVFSLSGHADCNQLLEYVQRSEAKRVFTVHGFDTEFAQLVKRKLGVEARPLKTLASKLTEWVF